MSKTEIEDSNLEDNELKKKVKHNILNQKYVSLINVGDSVLKFLSIVPIDDCGIDCLYELQDDILDATFFTSSKSATDYTAIWYLRNKKRLQSDSFVFKICNINMDIFKHRIQFLSIEESFIENNTDNQIYIIALEYENVISYINIESRKHSADLSDATIFYSYSEADEYVNTTGYSIVDYLKDKISQYGTGKDVSVHIYNMHESILGGLEKC